MWGQAMFELAARLGGRMSDDARARTVGTSMRVSMGVLHDDLGRPEARSSSGRTRAGSRAGPATCWGRASNGAPAPRS